MDSCKGGMNPVAMTIINPHKEYWLSTGSAPVLKSCMLLTELRCSAVDIYTSNLPESFTKVSLGLEESFI